MKKQILYLVILLANSAALYAQNVLPFPPTPTASIPGRTLAESVHKRRVEEKHLPPDAPNILIILIDDAGPGLPDTYGGEVHTPTLSKIAGSGISYNRFHSTAMCSPTRASLLTGRNHTRVGNGQITELSNDFDGFSGVIPKTSATIAEILKNYGYSTSAFGKWHNSPASQTTKAGPFDYWPTGYGFEYFYGFLAGEASQYEPTLVKNTTFVNPPKTPEEGYHLSDDLADNAIEWIDNHQALEPQKPFFMYWATGAVHGPHHTLSKWADKYKGKFDDGWDKYRERTFARQKKQGWIPQNAQLTARPETMASWESIPETEKPFQRRLMEIFAGFAEQADYDAGRIIEELERLGIRENTLVFYIWGDNGSSSEGQLGTISELLAQNQIPTKVEDHIKAMDELGGLKVLGTPKADNMYHAGWAWAGSTPYKGTKLQGAYFGGIRQPLAVSWPKGIKPDKKPHSQFSHVNDIAPTIYEILKIKPPVSVNGFQQDPIDGVSMLYSFNNADAKTQKKTQFFDIMGSRGIYSDGWFACTFGPRIPWVAVTPGLATWTPDKDKWELYNLEEDFTQANDLATKNPEKLDDLKQLFLIQSAENKNLPIGGGLWTIYHPEDAIQNPANSFHYQGEITRIPEFSAPKIGNRPNTIIVNAEVPENGNGVLFALGAFSGGLTCFVEDGIIKYEYNLFEVKRTKISSKEKLKPGKAVIEVTLQPKASPLSKMLHSADLTIKANGKEVAKGEIPILITLGFTANECLDIGTDLGSPVSQSYYDKAPFKFNGTINSVDIKYN
ncbi:arylsulfatase [Flavobacterium ustbae]|uniref:arylsulfatase n=1 Tax=Flavobacterium ustbae TaxID=2488790 RepID=UPI000F780300|nr:arylsulfatase [Flavobacterium ustbae]